VSGTTENITVGRPTTADVDSRQWTLRAARSWTTPVTVGAIWLAVLVFHLVVPRVAEGPVWSDDELAVIANARVM
jgi:hypothetical protein